MKVDHHDFVIGELDVRVFQDWTSGDEVEVTECEDDVVDAGGTMDLRRSETDGADTGVGRVGGAGEWKTTVKYEEGGRGEEVGRGYQVRNVQAMLFYRTVVVTISSLFWVPFPPLFLFRL